MNSQLSSHIFSSVTFIYGLAATLYLAAWIFRKEKIGPVATGVILSATVGMTAGILIRWIETYRMGHGYAPLSNLYESLIFFSFCISVLYLWFEKRTGHRGVGVFVAFLIFFAMAYASLPNLSDPIREAMTGANIVVADDRIRPLIPALKSNWLIAHVITCFIGYAAFGIAFALGLIYLIRSKRPDPPERPAWIVPDVHVLDELNYRMVLFGFFFLTIGIITGAVWANSAWGRYWGWDPKETWSLVTWILYATMLHARMMHGWEGRRIAYFSIAGFLAVLMTWFGVNYLEGLHSYGV